MSDAFEARDWDAAGRTGELRVPSGATVRTPALLPVVNPRRITVDPARFPEFGAEALITNAYIIHGDDDLRERACEQGLHEMLGFDGAIMTDSGSFQLAEYGDIDVTTPEILQFQRDIGSDIGTPVDVPTPPDADRERAAADVETTTERLHEAERADTGDMLVTAPVQGATYPDLREAAAREAAATDLDVFPVGGVVPLLNAYRFDAVVEATLAAKRGLAPDAPVHLFGAGHPVTFALAAAAGCDLFDSAAYAVYARDGRYLTPRGTRHLEDLGAFPCACPICVEHEPADLRRRDDAERERLLAEHNLYTSFAEMRRVRQAIQAGTLLELVETRARAHPRMLDGYRALLDGVDQIDARDPASKATFFYVSPESARRPEVARHHARLDRVADRASGDVLLVEPTATHNAPSAKFDAGGLAPSAGGGRWSHGAESGDIDDGGSNPGARPSTAAAHEAAARAAERGGPDPETFDAVWLVRPPFGPFPGELAATYPLSAELPDEMDPAGQGRAARGVARLAELTDAALTLAHRGWADTALAALPDGVTAVDVAPGAGEHAPDAGDDSSGGAGA